MNMKYSKGGQMALIGFILVLVIFITTFCQRRSQAAKQSAELVVAQESRQKRHKQFFDENLREAQTQVKTETQRQKKKLPPKVPDRRKKKTFNISNV